MNRFFFCLIAILLLLPMTVGAVTTGFIFYDPTDDGILNTSIWAVQSGNVTEGTDGYILFEGLGNILFSKINASHFGDDGATNFTISFRVNLSNSDGTSGGGYVDDGATSSTLSYHGALNNMFTGGRLYYDSGAGFVNCGPSPTVTDGQYIKIIHSQGDDMFYVYNGSEWDGDMTEMCSVANADGGNLIPQFVLDLAGKHLRIGDIRLYNESALFELVGIPNITRSSYNVTSAYVNSTAWATDTKNVVGTRDSTPTINFTITTAGNCSVSLNNSNYTEMVSIDPNTQCSTTDTTDQLCTLPSTEALSSGDNNMYIGCIASAGGVSEFENSTSGPLRINFDTLPSINQETYNVTNAYDNETIWQSDITSACRTRNRTVSVNFTVNEISNCSSSLNQSNYTEMISININTRCGTLDATKHQCVLPSTEALVDGRQGLFVSCIDVLRNEPSGGSTSSGNLTIAMDFSMSFNITHRNNSAYIGAEIVIMDSANNTKEGNVTTNSSGTAKLFIPEPGTYHSYTFDPNNLSIIGNITTGIVLS